MTFLGELKAQANLVALYHLQANSNDDSGNARNCTDVNITYGRVNGKFDQGALFNSTTSKMYAANNVLDLNSTNFTINAWVKPVTISESTARAIFSKNDTSGSGPGYIFLMNTNGTIMAWEYDNAGVWAKACASSKPLTAGKFNMATYTHIHGGASAVFINGAKLGTGTGKSWTNTQTFSRPAIGGAVASPSLNTAYIWNGQIDEVSVFTRVLSNSEIRKLYQVGAGKLQ